MTSSTVSLVGLHESLHDRFKFLFCHYILLTFEQKQRLSNDKYNFSFFTFYPQTMGMETPICTETLVG